MDRTPTRTEIVEAFEAKINQLNQLGYDALTLARSYGDLAEEIMKLPSRGNQFDVAKRELAAYSQKRNMEEVKTSEDCFGAANNMRSDGVEGYYP